LFKDTLEKKTSVKTFELPIFIPVVMEQDEEGFYLAKSYGYDRCKGMGHTEEEALQTFKKEIDRYHKSWIAIEKKMKMEEMVKNIFSKDPF
jgi:predicted RNase H-like HicB family nuclease